MIYDEALDVVLHSFTELSIQDAIRKTRKALSERLFLVIAMN